MNRRKRERASALLFVVAALFVGAAIPSAALADPAEALYQPGRVDVIKLTLSPEEQGKLEAEPEEYVEGTFSFAETDGTPGGVGPFSTPQKVEVRLKGDASFKDLSGKAAFKLKFAKTEAFLGLRKMTLNNMVEDPSMTHETLAYTAFRAAGVPAPRTSFAYVYVNGVDYGLHLDLETLDNVALEKLFGSFDKKTQHLYEGESGDDVRVGGAGDFEVDEGDEANLTDLETLIAAVNSSGPAPWSTRVAANADLAEMTRMWAVERYIGQRDGYAGVESPFQPNNYYLYSDPTGKFQMLPWGTDETWQERNHLPFDEGVGLMFTHCLEDAACADTYRGSLATACGAIGVPGLDALAVNTATLLAPWQQQEQSNSRHEHDLQEIEEGVDETRAFVASRPAEAADWLDAPCGSVGPPPDTNPATTPTAEIVSSTSLPTEPALGFRVGRAVALGRAVSTQMHLPTAGTITQRATIATEDGTIVACQARREVKRARDLTLNCPLSTAVRERLRVRWLRPKLVTAFSPSGGSPEAITHHVTLPRTQP